MKITKNRLKQIIKEELEEYKARLAPEEQSQQAVQKAVNFLIQDREIILATMVQLSVQQLAMDILLGLMIPVHTAQELL